MRKKVNIWVIITGLFVGISAVLLTQLGNPANMGFCIACFLRDIAGATKMHTAAAVQYVRPEIIGIVLGAMIMAMISGEFNGRAGSSPALRFVIGAFVMIGALVFLGCPLRMVIRIGGGDLNALVGLAGFAVGILIGIFFLRRGFSMKRNYEIKKTEALVMPLSMAGLLILVLAVPALFAFSEKGPGSMHAPFAVSLIIGLIVGALAQKSRLCTVGGMRDAFMFKDFNLLSGFVIILLTVFIGNLITGDFTGFAARLQPVSHTAEWWNFLGMLIVGWGSVLLGGCPLRQLILAGEGNGDSAVTVFGMIVGAAFAHNFALAGSPDSMKDGVYSSGGIAAPGKAAVIIALAVFAFISIMNTRKDKN